MIWETRYGIIKIVIDSIRPTARTQKNIERFFFFSGSFRGKYVSSNNFFHQLLYAGGDGGGDLGQGTYASGYFWGPTNTHARVLQVTGNFTRTHVITLEN